MYLIIVTVVLVHNTKFIVDLIKDFSPENLLVQYDVHDVTDVVVIRVQNRKVDIDVFKYLNVHMTSQLLQPSSNQSSDQPKEHSLPSESSE